MLLLFHYHDHDNKLMYTRRFILLKSCRVPTLVMYFLNICSTHKGRRPSIWGVFAENMLYLHGAWFLFFGGAFSDHLFYRQGALVLLVSFAILINMFLHVGFAHTW